MADVTHVLILFMVSVILSFMVDKLTGITADAVAVSVLQNYYKPLTDSKKNVHKLSNTLYRTIFYILHTQIHMIMINFAKP